MADNCGPLFGVGNGDTLFGVGVLLPEHLVEFEKKWQPIAEAVKKLTNFLEDKSNINYQSDEYMAHYSATYDLAVARTGVPNAQELYRRYKLIFEDYIKATVLPSLLEKEDTASLLKAIAERWSNHHILFRWLRHFFSYLARFYVKRHSLPTLEDVAVTCFRELVYNRFHARVKDGALQLINKERDGEAIDRSILSNIVDLFISVGLKSMDCYTDDLESPILLSTADYYSRLATEHIIVDSCPEYMMMAEGKLRLEEERVLNCLHSNTRPKLMKVLRDELLKNVEVQLLEKEHSGLKVLLREDKVEDLKRMYILFCHVDGGLEQIIPIYTQHIIDDGKELIKQAQNAFENKVDNKDTSGYEMVFVKKVFDLHDKQIGYVSTCFRDNTMFQKALRTGFVTICNTPVAGTDMAELLSTYVDNILKRSGRREKSTDEMIEEMLDKSVELLAYIENKDHFAEFCRKKLSWRLLLDKSVSDEHEKYLVSRLKHKHGGQFTSKMEGMIRDLQLASEFQAEYVNFQAELGSEENLGIEVAVSVLTTGFWPTNKRYDIHLPSEMTRALENFQTFYSLRNKSKKLTWLLSMGTCLLIGKFIPKSIELLVSTPQAGVLMLFNDSAKLSFKEITEQLNVSEDDVIRILHSLSCTKYKILCKSPDTKSISKNDIFTFNLKFTDKSRRIKVPLPPMDEKKKVIENVSQDRICTIRAAIVRIMKSRKSISHSELISETVQQLSYLFKPDVKAIKKGIEHVIDHEYMKRDPEDTNKYIYIA